MKPPLIRRRLLVRGFQYRLITYQALYFLALGLGAYLVLSPLFADLGVAQANQDQQLLSARILLFLDGRGGPIFVPLLVVLFAHSVLVSHRVAGPLYRFGVILRALGAGDLSMRVRIRKRDYLQEEAALFDQALAHLRERLLEARTRAHELRAALGEDDAATTHETPPMLARARRAAAELETALQAFELGSEADPAARDAGGTAERRVA